MIKGGSVYLVRLGILIGTPPSIRSMGIVKNVDRLVLRLGWLVCGRNLVRDESFCLLCLFGFCCYYGVVVVVVLLSVVVLESVLLVGLSFFLGRLAGLRRRLWRVVLFDLDDKVLRQRLVDVLSGSYFNLGEPENMETSE